MIRYYLFFLISSVLSSQAILENLQHLVVEDFSPEINKSYIELSGDYNYFANIKSNRNEFRLFQSRPSFLANYKYKNSSFSLRYLNPNTVFSTKSQINEAVLNSQIDIAGEQFDFIAQSTFFNSKHRIRLTDNGLFSFAYESCYGFSEKELGFSIKSEKKQYSIHFSSDDFSNAVTIPGSSKSLSFFFRSKVFNLSFMYVDLGDRVEDENSVADRIEQFGKRRQLSLRWQKLEANFSNGKRSYKAEKNGSNFFTLEDVNDIAFDLSYQLNFAFFDLKLVTNFYELEMRKGARIDLWALSVFAFYDTDRIRIDNIYFRTTSLGLKLERREQFLGNRFRYAMQYDHFFLKNKLESRKRRAIIPPIIYVYDDLRNDPFKVFDASINIELQYEMDFGRYIISAYAKQLIPISFTKEKSENTKQISNELSEGESAYGGFFGRLAIRYLF